MKILNIQKFAALEFRVFEKFETFKFCDDQNFKHSKNLQHWNFEALES